MDGKRSHTNQDSALCAKGFLGGGGVHLLARGERNQLCRGAVIAPSAVLGLVGGCLEFLSQLDERKR